MKLTDLTGNPGDSKRTMDAVKVNERTALFEQLEKEVLRINITEDSSLKEILEFYTLGIERLFPRLKCSIMKLRDGRLFNWASPSLPPDYLAAIEGEAIGAGKGSCGTAAFLNQRVVVSDISHDPFWKDFKEPALRHNLRACWSQPICNSRGKVIGTFALYYNEPGAPSEEEISIIGRSASVLQLIIENRRYADNLKEASVVMSQGQELAGFGSWSWYIPENRVRWSDTLYSIYGLNPDKFPATFEGYLERVHPDDRSRVTDIIQNILIKGNDGEFEERIYRPGGELRYLRSWAKPIFDETGKPIKMIGACLDITETKKTQMRLTESRAELQKMLERYHYVNKATNDAIYDWDIVGDDIEWGESFYRIFHFKQDNKPFNLDKWKAMVHPPDLPAIAESLKNTLLQPQLNNWRVSYRLHKGNGELVFVDENGYILRNESGGAVRMIGVLRDVTERKRQEEELRLSKDRYSDLFQLSPLPVIVYEQSSLKILDVNKSAIDLYAYSHKEFLNITFAELYSSAENEKLRMTAKTGIQADFANDGIFTHVKKNGETIYVSTRGNSIQFNGRQARIVVVIDITERTLQELKNKQLLDRYNTVSMATSDIIRDFDVTTGEVVWNQAVEVILGYEANNYSYQWWLDHIHPDDFNKVTEAIKAAVDRTGQRWICDYRFICADGNYKHILDRDILIYDETGKLVRMIGSMQDITEPVKHLREIEDQNKRLREISWAQSHLVRAPLSGIMGLVSLLKEGGLDESLNAAILEDLSASAKELDRIISDIISKSKTYRK